MRWGARSAVRPVLQIFDPDGNAIDPGAVATAGGRAAKVRGFPVPRTGLWTVRVASADGAEGAYSVRLRIASPPPTRFASRRLGAAEPLADQCARALACAEDMHRFVEASAPQWRETYGIDVRLGVGVNAGEALVGNLGSESRMEYTVIGDVVNVAARLEALARGGQTLVTGAVAKQVGGAFSLSPLGAHPLRGKREPVEIFEVMP